MTAGFLQWTNSSDSGIKQGRDQEGGQSGDGEPAGAGLGARGRGLAFTLYEMRSHFRVPSRDKIWFVFSRENLRDFYFQCQHEETGSCHFYKTKNQTNSKPMTLFRPIRCLMLQGKPPCWNLGIQGSPKCQWDLLT